jgi:hypothetical protein
MTRRALDVALGEWGRLPAGTREEVPNPRELLEDLSS